MSWYYTDNKKILGPLSGDAIKELYACGKLTDNTLVRQEGAGEWLRYDEAFKSVADYSQSSTPTNLEENMLNFSCSYCDARITTEQEFAGMTANCPSCGEDLMVPTVSAASAYNTKDPILQLGMQNDESTPGSLLPSIDSNSATSNAFGMQLMETPPPEDPMSPDGTPGPTIGARLSTFAAGVAQEAKLGSKIALLKGRIESASQIELRKAHYALGRKLYKSRILLGMQDEIEALERHIAESGERVIVEEHESKGAMLKRLGKNAAKRAESELLSLKLKQALAHLGSVARNTPQHYSLVGTENETAAIIAVESKIQHLQEEVFSLEAINRTLDQQSKKLRIMKGPLAAGIFGLGLVILAALSLAQYYRMNNVPESVSIPTRQDSRKSSERMVTAQNYDRTPAIATGSVDEEGNRIKSILEGVMFEMQKAYPQLSKEEVLRKIEDLVGFRIDSREKAKRASVMMERMLMAAKIAGETPR